METAPGHHYQLDETRPDLANDAAHLPPISLHLAPTPSLNQPQHTLQIPLTQYCLLLTTVISGTNFLSGTAPSFSSSLLAVKASRHASLSFFNTDSGRNRDDCFCLERAESEECKSMLIDVGVGMVWG